MSTTRQTTGQLTPLQALGQMINKFQGLAPLHIELFREAIATWDNNCPRQWCQQCAMDHTGFYCTGEAAYFGEARAAIAKERELHT